MLGGTIRGSRVLLRMTEEPDLADHLKWHADGEATEWMPYRPRAEALHQRHDWLTRVSDDHQRIHWEIALGTAHVGYCAVQMWAEPMAEGCSLTHLFVEQGSRRSGVGFEAALTLHRYLITYLGLRFVDAWLIREDAAARRIFERLGYVEYGGGRRAFYRAGRYLDEWLGLVTAEDFRARFPAEREYPEREGD